MSDREQDEREMWVSDEALAKQLAAFARQEEVDGCDSYARRLREAARRLRRPSNKDTDAVSRLCHLAEVIESDPDTSDQYAEHIWEITEDMELRASAEHTE